MPALTGRAGGAGLVALVLLAAVGCSSSTAGRTLPAAPTTAVSLPVVAPATTATGPAAASTQVPAPVAAPVASPPAPGPSATSAAVVDHEAVAPASLPLPRSAPVRIRIPAINVDSALMRLGLKADGSLQVPPRGFPAGWYTGSPTPGELGPAVIVGHVDWAGSAGVFYRLHSLRIGDRITVVRANGSTAVFRVSKVAHYSKQAFPTALVYGNIGYAGLRLITCGGSFDRAKHSYVQDVVVFAALVH
jgi:hypothetical protein